MSENTRPVVDTHPQKIHVSSVQPTEHNPDEGWKNMTVQWVVTDGTVGAEHTVLGITTFPPDACHDIHRHPHAEEFEYLVSGEGIARIGDADVHMRAGDVVFVKTGEAHGFWNTSKTDNAVLVWGYGGAPSLDAAGYVYEPDVPHGEQPVEHAG